MLFLTWVLFFSNLVLFSWLSIVFFQLSIIFLKLASAIFYQIFIFHQMIALQKLWKIFFILSKNLFSFLRNFCILVFSSFFPVTHCFRGCSKKNLKIYDVINCLIKNLITNFVWYLEKEIRCDSDTLFIDRELNMYGTFLWKNHAENVHQKLDLELFLILLNNAKQPFQARNPFKNKVFWKKINKKPLKKLSSFFLSNLLDKVTKNKRGLELVTSPSWGHETSSEKFLYLLYIIWPSLISTKAVFELFQKLHLDIYASQFMTS